MLAVFQAKQLTYRRAVCTCCLPFVTCVTSLVVYFYLVCIVYICYPLPCFFFLHCFISHWKVRNQSHRVISRSMPTLKVFKPAAAKVVPTAQFRNSLTNQSQLLTFTNNLAKSEQLTPEVALEKFMLPLSKL